MEKVFSISWSNRILLISLFSVSICMTIQTHVAHLTVPLHFLISWAIFVITISIWLSCFVLRLMLKVNAPLTTEPFNKWAQGWMKNDQTGSGRQPQKPVVKRVDNDEETKDENQIDRQNTEINNLLRDLRADGNLDDGSVLEQDLPVTFVEKINVEKVINDIDANFVKIWYRNVSNDDAFPNESKQLLENLILKFNHQLIRIDRIELARKIGNIFLLHLKEYRRALRRVEKGTALDIEEAYRYVHPGSRSLAALEHSLHRVVTVLAREFLQWELTSSLPCKLLFSILAKKLLTGIESISSPEWILEEIVRAISSEPVKNEKCASTSESVVSTALSDAIRSTTAAAISRPLPKAGQGADISPDFKDNNQNAQSTMERKAALSLEGLEISHRGLWANVEISEPDSEPEEDRLSPVYEEPTDFATTIARLRSLLHQKSNASTPLQLEEKSCTVYEGSHLTIPWTEFHTAPDGSQQLLYCIQFDDIEQHGSHLFETTTATVKRQYSDFVQLHASLAEVPSLAVAISNITLPEGGRVEMENYLKLVCSRLAADYPPQLRHFLRPSSSSNKKADTVAPRLDRFLAKTVSGVFNTLKTVVPGFEMDTEIEVMPMPTLMSLADVPWRFVEDLKSQNLARELQQLVAERMDYCSVDTAYEAVESVEGSGDSELLAHWWEIFNTPYDEELDELDSKITLTQLVVDLASEVLGGSGCDNVIEQEAVVRTVKLFFGNIAETTLKNSILKSFKHLDNLDIFASSGNENTKGLDILQDELLQQLMSAIPPHIKIFLGDNETSEAFKFLMRSLDNKKINRDLCLQLLDVLASQLLATSRSTNQGVTAY
ncbi:uncharacterized protein LOC124187716 isoform X1 [Neodiprion fabricii]|uniref:uncharacterized protein LOC124187716 isoform X1 n=1 Tax=Neodiprion fabricii TaxID=2872261 RepID=UPI001ED8F9AC|nr:uncharacterized protein LOC124187716 isoform X1 [Neodiprion fabricii]